MLFVLSGIADRLALGTGRQRSTFSIENQVKAIAEETLNQITTVIESIKAHELAGEATTVVASFIQRELVFFQNVLGKAVKETELFINACSGHVAFTPDLFNLASSLGSHRAPPKWLVKSATDVSLSGWLSDVQRQVKALGGYLSTSPLHPCSYCLGAFAHPQAFLACVLMDHARVTMKSVYALEFSVEVIAHCNNALHLLHFTPPIGQFYVTCFVASVYNTGHQTGNVFLISFSWSCSDTWFLCYWGVLGVGGKAWFVSSIGHFRVLLCLCFKTSLSV